MKRPACSALLVSLLVLGGCATRTAPSASPAPPIALKSLQVAAAPSAATSPKKVALSYVSSNVHGVESAPIVVSGNLLFSSPPDRVEGTYFNLQDQIDTVAALQDNLVRLKVFEAVELTSAPRAADLKIFVIFDDSFYEERSMQYTLKATLQVHGGPQRFRKEYIAQSAQPGWLSRMSTTAAKSNVAKGLLEQMVTDLQTYAANPG